VRGHAAHRSHRAVVLAILSVVPGVGCFSDPAGDMLGGEIEPTLSSIQEHVFTPTCAVSGCHAPPAQLDLDLSPGNAHASLVGVASVEQPSRNRVTPGDAVESYLYMKVTGDPRISGDRMPAGGAPLSAGEIEAIRAWIEDGAADD